LLGAADRFVGAVFRGTRVSFYSGPTLVPLDTWQLGRDGGGPEAVLLFGLPPDRSLASTVLAMYRWGFVYYDQLTAFGHEGGGWVPGVPPDSRLAQPVLSWLDQGAEGLEVAGIDGEGNVYSSQVRFEGVKLSAVSTQAKWQHPRILAAAVMRPGLIAA